MARWGLFLLFFIIAFSLCGLISYTDGDDAYFSEMSHQMALFPYLKMRFIGWEGRITSEAMTYVAFYFGKAFWQPANACVLTLLVAGLTRLVEKLFGMDQVQERFFLAAAMCLVILSLGIEVIGYGAFWITGSTFYLWSITAGIWAAMPFAELMNRCGDAKEERNREKPVGQNSGTGRSTAAGENRQTGHTGRRCLIYGIPCAFLAAMGQEQIAAVVITFGALAVCYYYSRKRTIAWGALLEVLLMIAALVILFLSPGTEARSQAEIAQWMPQYDTMSVGNHLFITVQWILSSFAREGRMLFALIWILGMWILLSDRKESAVGYQNQNKTAKKGLLVSFSGIFALGALSSYLEFNLLSDLGCGVTDITSCVEEVATPASLTWENWVAFFWWTAAVLFTLFLLWSLMDRLRDRVICCLLLLAACASEAIMYFSPTMYASGARVYFVAQILLWLIIGILAQQLIRRGKAAQVILLLTLAGLLNAAAGIPTVLSYL